MYEKWNETIWDEWAFGMIIYVHVRIYVRTYIIALLRLLCVHTGLNLIYFYSP